MRIAFVNRAPGDIEPSRFRPFLHSLAAYLDAPAADLTVLFCGDPEMSELNAAWRGLREPTDVLSFPGGGASGRGRAYLGDLAISLDTAARAARRAGRPVAREIETLLAHGLLHLLGFDHEVDDGTMMRLQARVLRHARALGHGRALRQGRALPRRRALREARSNARSRSRRR